MKTAPTPIVPDPYPNHPETIRALGRSAVDLLGRTEQWVLRRKEKLTLLDETISRRQTSVDFSLPDNVQPLAYWNGKPVRFAPLFFLQKGSDEPFDPFADRTAPERHFANFDLCDGSGRSWSLPSRTWNAKVAGAMLEAIVDRASAKVTPAIDQRTRDATRQIVRIISGAEQRHAERLLNDLRDGTGRDGGRQGAAERHLQTLDAENADLRRWLDVMVVSSVVMVPLVGDEMRRGILKLAYDLQVTETTSTERVFAPLRAALGWGGYELWVEAPFAGSASYHFELEAPDGLEVYDAGLFDHSVLPRSADRQGTDSGRLARVLQTLRSPFRSLRERKSRRKRATSSRKLAEASGFASRLHLYVGDAGNRTGVAAWIRLRVRRHEFIGGAACASFLTMAVLWAAVVGRQEAGNAPGSAPTLLLLTTSLVAAYVVRPGAHRLTTWMLRLTRLLMVACAALPVIAAGALALTPREQATGIVTGTSFYLTWWIAAVVATVLFVAVSAGRLFPRPQIELDRIRAGIRKIRSRPSVDPEGTSADAPPSLEPQETALPSPSSGTSGL